MNKRDYQKQLSGVKKTVRDFVKENKLQEGVKHLFNYCYNDCDFIEMGTMFADCFIIGSDIKVLLKEGANLANTGDIADINNVNDNSLYQWKTFIGGDIEVKNLDSKYIKESLKNINFEMWI